MTTATLCERRLQAFAFGSGKTFPHQLSSPLLISWFQVVRGAVQAAARPNEHSRRQNYLHKVSTTISENHAMVAVEDLQMSVLHESKRGQSYRPGDGAVTLARAASDSQRGSRFTEGRWTSL
jgi:hypothetical protein